MSNQIEQIREAYLAEQKKPRPNRAICDHLRRALNRLVIRKELQELNETTVRKVPYVESALIDGEGRVLKKELVLREADYANRRHES